MARIVQVRNPRRASTPQLMDKWNLAYDAHLARYGSPEAAREYADHVTRRSNPSSRITNNADRFEEWLEQHEVEYSRHGGSDSQYFYIELPDETLTIRFSDHRSPPGGGYSAEFGYQHGDPDISVHPGGASPAQARKLVQSRYKDWKRRSKKSKLAVSTKLEKEIASVENRIASRERAIRDALRSGDDPSPQPQMLERDRQELAKLQAHRSNPFMESLVGGVGTGTGLALAAGVAGPFVVRRVKGALSKVGVK